MFYRKSVFEQYGYAEPKTLDEFKTPLATQMRKDGLVPIAFGDKDGWPAMGTFDQLEPAGQRLPVPRRPDGRQGGLEQREGQDGLRHLGGAAALPPARLPGSHLAGGRAGAQQKKAGIYLLGSFVAQQFAKGAEQEDLDFFNFPEIDSTTSARTRSRRRSTGLHDRPSGPRTRPAPRSCSATLGSAEAAEHRRQGRPQRHRDQRQGRHGAYTVAAEEVGRVRRRRRQHRAVPGPRHPPRLRLDGDDPGDPDLPAATRTTSTVSVKSIEKQKKRIFAS